MLPASSSIFRSRWSFLRRLVDLAAQRQVDAEIARHQHHRHHADPQLKGVVQPFQQAALQVGSAFAGFRGIILLLLALGAARAWRGPLAATAFFGTQTIVKPIGGDACAVRLASA